MYTLYVMKVKMRVRSTWTNMGTNDSGHETYAFMFLVFGNLQN